MGATTNAAHWITDVHMQGTRTSQKVARYLGGLVVRLHRKAQEAEKTTEELPANVQGLTQYVEKSEANKVPMDTEPSDVDSTDTESDSGSDSSSHR